MPDARATALANSRLFHAMTSSDAQAILAAGIGRGLRKGQVLIRGHRCPVVGRVTMNTIMVDVTDFPDVQLSDEVVLFGKQGSDEITQAELEGIDGVDVGGVADDDAQDAIFFVQGEDLVLLDEVGRDKVEVGGGHGPLVEVDVLHVILEGEGLGDLFFGSEAKFQDDLMEGEARLGRLFHDFLDVGGLERAHFDQVFRDLFLVPRHGVPAFELSASKCP